jgi:phospholipase/lecithinase/hemolysin
MYMFRTRLSALLSALLIASLFLFTGCDDDSLTPAPVEDDLFARYVSLGNSITAGLQSSGINAATQQDAYPVLLAEQMGTPFNSPLLAGDGCPPPLTNAITGERAGSTPCGLRQAPPVRLNNVAVPGSAVVDLLDNSAPRNNANVLTQLFLGGRTQVEAAVEAEPTFVTIWTGNNDVLNAAFAGVVTPETVTPVSNFEARYTEALNELEAAGAQGGVLFGVSDITLIPHFSAGAAYAAAENQINAVGNSQSPAWGSFSVDASCAPSQLGTTTLVPANYGLSELLARALEGADVTLNCATDERVLSGEEVALVQSRVDAYNSFIQSEANERGWVYQPINPTLNELRESGAIPPFPNFSDPTGDFFGTAFSLDGIHPNSATHQVVANTTIEAINAEYGTSLSTIE